MANKVTLNLPSLSDPADISVINSNIEKVADSYNQHLDETDSVQNQKITLLMQIIDQCSFFDSNITSLRTQLSSASTNDDKITILKQIVNQISFFSSSTGKVLLEQINNL